MLEPYDTFCSLLLHCYAAAKWLWRDWPTVSGDRCGALPDEPRGERRNPPQQRGGQYMKRKFSLAALAVVLCGLVAGALPAAAATNAASATSTTAAPYCGITWGSLPKAAEQMSQAQLLETRTGRHDCYDRVVFEFAGSANGYRVEYGEAYTQGRGDALSPYTAGGALLNVVLLEPAYGPSGSYPHASGDHVANVVQYRTLRDVVFGGSFEGYTTFAVGVRARLPYRVFTLTGPGTHSRIVIDIAHQWQG
jgi:hypothetical protein